MAFEDLSIETGPYTFTQTGEGSSIDRTTVRWWSNNATGHYIFMDDGARLYKDFGVGYFGDFTLQFEWYGHTAGWGTWAGHFVGFSNEENDHTAIVDAGDSVWLRFHMDGAYEPRITLSSIDDGTPVTDTTYGTVEISRGVTYYITFVRSGTSITVTIRTTSHTGDVVDTLNVTGVSTAMRYFYPLNSQTTGGSTAKFVGWGQNFEFILEEETNMQINIGDAWKTVNSMQINIGDAWKDVNNIQINIGDVWKTVF